LFLRQLCKISVDQVNVWAAKVPGAAKAVLANIDFSGGIGDFIDLFDGVPSSVYQLPLPYSIPAINPLYSS
jgi:hypothetical protein